MLYCPRPCHLSALSDSVTVNSHVTRHDLVLDSGTEQYLTIGSRRVLACPCAREFYNSKLCFLGGPGSYEIELVGIVLIRDILAKKIDSCSLIISTGCKQVLKRSQTWPSNGTSSPLDCSDEILKNKRVIDAVWHLWFYMAYLAQEAFKRE